jgi:hypothetical protein
VPLAEPERHREVNLWQAVLLQAQYDSTNIEYAHSIRDWAYEHSKKPGSLEFCCDICGLSYDKVKSRLIQNCNSVITPENIVNMLWCKDFTPRTRNDDGDYEYWTISESRKKMVFIREVQYCLEYGNKKKRKWQFADYKGRGYTIVDAGTDSIVVRDSANIRNLWYNANIE